MFKTLIYAKAKVNRWWSMDKVLVILIGLQIFCLIGLAFNTYFMKRNHKVKDFRLKVIHLNSDLETYQISLGKKYSGHKIYKKLPSYNRMVYSFKKLTLENYLDQKDIDQLMAVKNIKNN